MRNNRRGRPMASHDVKITPEFRDNPDLEKLGRALIAVAISIAQKKRLRKRPQRRGVRGTI